MPVEIKSIRLVSTFKPVTSEGSLNSPPSGTVSMVRNLTICYVRLVIITILYSHYLLKKQNVKTTFCIN